MKKIRNIFLYLLVLLVLTIFSCYYDSEEFLFPEVNNTCDTTNVTYSKSVVPIIGQYCLGCHSNNSAAGFGGNIKLENYSDIKTMADNGMLEGTVTHSQGFSPMPKGSSKLKDCEISILKTWAGSQAPNN